MNRSAPHIDVRVLCNDDYDAVIRLVSELDADERYRRFLTRYPTYIGEWALSLTTPSDRGCALGAFESGDLLSPAASTTLQCVVANCAALCALDSSVERSAVMAKGLQIRAGRETEPSSGEGPSYRPTGMISIIPP